MRSADLWYPLAALGPERGARLELALGGATIDEVERCLADLEASVTDEAGRAALLAGRFSLGQRAGAARIDEVARAAQQAFLRLGDARAAAFLEVELVAGLIADKTLLPEAGRMLDAVQVAGGDLALGAAVSRVRGAVARARADLRGSLLHLERARALAEASGHSREIIRTANTLGTSYAALGVASLARDALEQARELAELQGHRQSAAIAAGQLAVLALDAERPALAIRHLEVQRAICERIGDLHGLARSLSLLVEAHASAHDLARAQRSAEACRGLYARAPSQWTRLQAVMATVYEAECALASGDEGRAAELLRSCQDERASEAPLFRVAHARDAFVQLWALLRGESAGAVEAIEAAFASLRRSPRPTWVEKALLLAVEAARRHGLGGLAAPLVLRASSLIELRAAAASGALPTLRTLAPEAAVGRAMVFGRDLVFRARLALGPLRPFQAEVFEIEADDPDEALACFEVAGRPGELPDDLLAQALSPALLRVSVARATHETRARLRENRSLKVVERGLCRVQVSADPASLLGLHVAE